MQQAKKKTQAHARSAMNSCAPEAPTRARHKSSKLLKSMDQPKGCPRRLQSQYVCTISWL